MDLVTEARWFWPLLVPAGLIVAALLGFVLVTAYEVLTMVTNYSKEQ